MLVDGLPGRVGLWRVAGNAISPVLAAEVIGALIEGMIWQEIDGEGKLSIDRGFQEGFPVHAENVELIRRMATARGYNLEVGTEADGWTPVRLTYVGTGNSRPALSVVS